MDKKSTVVKSKSSNSAISKTKEGRSQVKEMNTRSNAKFPCRGVKKRGVYVEKRLTKTNLVNNDKEDCITQKPPPRPRPGQKNFLASVMTILSKSTTGTQYPERGGARSERKLKDEDPTVKESNNTGEDTQVNDTKKSKKEFKSKVLNRKFVREDKKKMIVLQSKKEIAQTPSNYSEWSYKDASQNSNVSNLLIFDDSNITELNIADQLKNAVLEGRNIRGKKLGYPDEPKTLVSDGAKGQKNLYNFFVDLLETTISVYNLKAEYDAPGPSDASKTNLQINESVANKLNIGKVKKAVEFEEGIVSPEKFQIQNDTDYVEELRNRTKHIIQPFTRDMPLKAHKRKLKVDLTKTMPPKSKSVEIRRKTTFKNKNDLINILKQELEIDNTFEEPKSIFQALRVMARNKKKISFDPSIDYKTFTDECILKRRKVISSRKVGKNKIGGIKNHVKPAFNSTDYIQKIKKRYADIPKMVDSETDVTESYHSLEVYGFDYEMKASKKPNFKPKNVTLTYHSSNSDVDISDAILNPASTMSSLRKFSAVVD